MNKPWPKNLKRYVDQYVHDCAEILRVGHWSIEVIEEETTEDGEPTWAETEVKKERFATKLRFGQKFWDSSADDKRQTVAHELLHCHTTPICWMAERLFKDDVPPSQWEAKESALDYQHEIATDEIATAIAPLLPEWAYEKGGKHD